MKISGNFSSFRESYVIKYQKSNNKENFILVPDQGKKLNSGILQNLLTNLIELKIDEYIINSGITVKDKSAAVRLNLKNGKSLGLDFYKVDKNYNGEYIIDADFNDFLYLIDDSKIKKIFIPINELIDTNSEENNKKT